MFSFAREVHCFGPLNDQKYTGWWQFGTIFIYHTIKELARCQKGDQMWVVNYCVQPQFRGGGRDLKVCGDEDAHLIFQGECVLWIINPWGGRGFTFNISGCMYLVNHQSWMGGKIHSWHFRVHTLWFMNHQSCRGTEDSPLSFQGARALSIINRQSCWGDLIYEAPLSTVATSFINKYKRCTAYTVCAIVSCWHSWI